MAEHGDSEGLCGFIGENNCGLEMVADGAYLDHHVFNSLLAFVVHADKAGERFP